MEDIAVDCRKIDRLTSVGEDCQLQMWQIEICEHFTENVKM